MSLLILDCPHYCISTASVLHQYCISTASSLLSLYQHTNIAIWQHTDTLLIHYWYTTDTLLIHYWYTTDTLLVHFCHIIGTSIAPVLIQYCPQYWNSTEPPPWQLTSWTFFFGTHFLCLHLRQILCNFWIFAFWLCFSLWHGGGLCPLPFPLPPEQSAGCPGAKPALLLRGEGEWEGAAF